MTQPLAWGWFGQEPIQVTNMEVGHSKYINIECLPLVYFYSP